MSVIIRLQNLPWSANALDIRTYFQGLSIPEGGVHIVGGELGDAFIAFSTDEDARQAMLIDGGKIKEVKIKLLLSSRSEMQKVIETARAQSIAMQSFLQIAPAPIPTTTLQVAQIPPTPLQTAPAMPVMTPLSHMPPKTVTPEVKPPSLPTLADIPTPEVIPDPMKQDAEVEKKDQGKDGDKESSHKDNKRTRRRSRSRSKNKSRSKSKDRSKSRDRSRSRDRYRSRRDRKRRDRSRDRSRDRRDRRRYRDRSRSRDRSRKSSREKKRDNDRNSLENGRNIEKDAGPPQPVAPNAVAKPGFKNSGWVSAGTTDKPLNPVLPPELSVGKPNLTQPLRKEMTDSPQLPQIQNRIQPSSATPAVPLQMPPSFPMDVLKNPDGSFGPIPFPAPTTMQNLPFTQKPPIKPEGELLHQPSGWPPMMGMPPGINLNAHMGANLPQFLNSGIGMYANPSIPQSPGRFPAPFTHDPRQQTTFPQQMNNFRSENPGSEEEHFSSQKGNFPEKDLDSASRPYFSNSCVEIRNMSLNTSVIDIKRFFQGIHIPRDGIKIITDKKGNKVGMAYVRFAKPFFKDLALKMNGQMLKNSAVELLPIEDQIFDKTADYSEYKSNFSEAPQPQVFNRNYSEFPQPNIPAEPFTDLVIHEVPPSANDNDIYNLFKNYSISDAFVLLGMGMKTTTGYVRFQNPTEAKRALMNSSRLSVRYQNVKVAACYETEFDDARDRKNMEEIDEEMDSSDNYDTSIPFNSRESSTSHFQESRYRNESRPKGLLPTPSSKPFGQRDPRGNNFHSQSDRRGEDRSTRGGYHRRPYDREDYHEKPPRERTRFAPRETNDPRRRPTSQNDGENNQEDQKRSFFVPSQRPTVPGPIVKVPPKVEPTTAPKINANDGPKSDSDDRPKTDSDDRARNQNPNLMKETHETAKADLATNTKPQINKEICEVSPVTKTETSAAPQVPPKETPPSVKPIEEKLSTPEVNRTGHSQEDRDKQVNKTLNFIDTDCLILKGLPFSATDRDILDFFSDEGLAPTQIHIMLDKQEKPAGDAFCEFSTVEEVERALSKNQTLMGRSVVTVEAVRREQMMEALGVLIHHPEPSYPEYPPRHHQQFYHPRGSRSRFPPPFLPRGRGRGAFRGRFNHPPVNREDNQLVNSFGKPGCVLALENVPFRAEVHDIIEFFRGYRLTKDNVIRRFDESGKATGDARVCLDSPADAQKALRTLNQATIMHRQIYLSLVP